METKCCYTNKLSFSSSIPSILAQGRFSKTRFGVFSNVRSSMRSSSKSPPLSEKQQFQQIDRILDGAVNDDHGGVIVEMTSEPLDPLVFASLLEASLATDGKEGYLD